MRRLATVRLRRTSVNALGEVAIRAVISRVPFGTLRVFHGTLLPDTPGPDPIVCRSANHVTLLERLRFSDNCTVPDNGSGLSTVICSVALGVAVTVTDAGALEALPSLTTRLSA